MTTCNLLAYKLDDVITVTRRMSRQINFSLHVEINYIAVSYTHLTLPTNREV